VTDRIRSLLDAGIALTSELSLDALLQNLTETAAELTGARYAALGVIDPNRSELERFVTTGLDPEAIARIGDLPRGRGILGVLIREAQPLRLHDINEHWRGGLEYVRVDAERPGIPSDGNSIIIELRVAY